jgi:Histone methylation protein DOT1
LAAATRSITVVVAVVTKPAATAPSAPASAGAAHAEDDFPAQASARPPLRRRVAGAVFRRAVRPAYVGLRRSLGQLAFERRSGIHTEASVELEELGLAAPDRSDYKPLGWLGLRRTLRRREVGRDDVFIDFGSGMGRVVFQAAAHYPFKRVIGVELSSELHAVAQQNISRARRRLCCPQVELVNADALEYDVPDDVTVVFFNNPFTGQIFERVVAKLVASLERKPRELRIVYANPTEDAVLRRAGARLVRRVRGLRPGAEWSRSNSIHLYTLGGAI